MTGMTPLLVSVVVFAEVLLVSGQVMTKRAMHMTNRKAFSRGRFAALLAGGVGMIGIYFFLWLGMMQKVDLSQLYPFDALAPLLLVLASMFFLGERLSLRSWAGIALIGVGLVMIAISQSNAL